MPVILRYVINAVPYNLLQREIKTKRIPNHLTTISNHNKTGVHHTRRFFYA